MVRFYTQSREAGGFPESLGESDPGLSGLLTGIGLGETPVVAVHAAKPVRSGFLDRLLPALRRDGVRSAVVSSLDGGEIGLASLMDQVIGRVCADQIDRLERCHAALTVLGPDENRIALVIDDAHLLTEQCIRYLDLMASVTRSNPAPLVIVLVGSPAIWDRLPLTGGLAAENVARRLMLDDAAPLGEPEAVVVPAAGQSLQVVNTARMLPMVLPHERPKRGWFAVAACAGSFAAVGGFAAGLYLDGLLTSRALWPRIMMTQASPVAMSPHRTAIATAPVSPAASVQQAGAAGVLDGPHDDMAAVDAALGAVAAAQVKAEGPPVADPVPAAGADQAVAVAEAATVVSPEAAAVVPGAASLVPAAAPVVPAAAPAPPQVVVAAVHEAATAEPKVSPVATVVAVPAPAALAVVSAPALEVAATDSAGVPSAPTVEPAPVAAASVAAALPSAPVGLPAPVTRIATAVPASVPVDPGSVAPPPMAAGMVAVLISRGDALLATGDVTAARLMYRRAADTQSIPGAVAMGMTFDPKVLAQIGVQGLPADTQLAAMWYQRAASLGSSDAVRLLRQLRSESAR